MSGRAEEEIIRTIEKAFPELVEEAAVLQKKRISVTISPEGLLEVARYLRDQLGFDHPISAGGIDFMREKLLQMVYYLMSSEKRIMLMLKVNIPRDNPVLPTLTQIWNAMSPHEREAWEMLGICFEEHPNLTHLLLPKDWEDGYPLRKDFKLRGKGVGS